MVKSRYFSLLLTGRCRIKALAEIGTVPVRYKHSRYGITELWTQPTRYIRYPSVTESFADKCNDKTIIIRQTISFLYPQTPQNVLVLVIESFRRLIQNLSISEYSVAVLGCIISDQDIFNIPYPKSFSSRILNKEWGTRYQTKLTVILLFTFSRSKIIDLEGPVSRDFRPSVFFIKQSPLGPWFTA
jgi:hypothetical protein